MVYQAFLERDTNAEMALFIRRALDKIGGTYSDDSAFQECVHKRSGILQFIDVPLDLVMGSCGTRTPGTDIHSTMVAFQLRYLAP